MASSAGSMWSALESSVDPSNMLHSRLASALSDAQYWEETISGSTIRKNLQETDPTLTASAPVLLKAMKWLLASISKGRDVSDFYVEVVKLVGTPNFEVRKLVYTYLVQYANHNAECRELSLLSINSFQRGLNDAEPLIRALALRVLTSVQQPDILQIQILAVTKHAQADTSPYVRKCAGIAMAKLAPRCDEQQKELLLEITEHLLNFDTMPMVLSSALVAFSELTNGDTKYLHILHHSYRKLCELLADLDEWGQVICMEILTRYCRFFFKEPRYYSSGSAEQVDATRRVKRRLTPDGDITTDPPNQDFSPPPPTPADSNAPVPARLPPYPKNNHRKIIKRRVVKKGFYSDEEDESTEEEVYADTMTSVSASPSAALRQTDIGTGLSSTLPGRSDDANQIDSEESDLDPDHLALLHAALPLLKSRNAGVVLAVCSLHYYCGVSSIRVRKAMGKALVRIHRDRHHQEIQYVVLSSIQRLVQECPSAFAPFLNDFFVIPDLDLSLTRLLKLDILTALALDPPSIEAVLAELRMYVQVHHHEEDEEDLEFVCAAVRAVGRVVELARICYTRQGRQSEATMIALNCLFGLTTLAQTGSHETVVGEAVTVISRIFPLLEFADDPNGVQERAFRFVLLLLLHTLSCVGEDDEGGFNSDDDSSHDESDLEKVAVVIPPSATASALWLVGDHLSTTSSAAFGTALAPTKNRSRVRFDVASLLVRGYLELEVVEKLQALHFATKLLASADGSCDGRESKLCAQLLALGRLDVDVNVRDRARHLSGIMRLAIGVNLDSEAMEEPPLSISNANIMSRDNVKRLFLGKHTAPSYLHLVDESGRNETTTDGLSSFRFGTLSSLVGHRARNAYQRLPPWASANSPGSLRDEIERVERPETNGVGQNYSQPQQFYGSCSSDDSDSSSTSDSSSSSSSSSEEDGDTSSSESSESSSDTDSGSSVPQESLLVPAPLPADMQSGSKMRSIVNSSSDSDSSEDFLDQKREVSGGLTNTLIPVGNETPAGFRPPSSSGGLADDFRGMTLAPVVTSTGERTDTDFDLDSGVWIPLVRPEHSRGLCVQGRFLRGVTKTQQAQLLGLTAEKPTVVCIQLRFQNKNPAGGSPFRHIRIVQKSSVTSGSSIGPSKIAAPLEIAQLGAGTQTECVLGMDFSKPSDKNGSLLAKLEIKFGSGGIPTEIKPTIGDLLLPCRRSVEEFDSAVDRMRGFNRGESKFSVPASDRSNVPECLVSRVALNTIGTTELAWDNDTLRLAATLPASGDPVYVVATCASSGQGKLVVCCDHALVVTAIVSLLKRSLADFE